MKQKLLRTVSMCALIAAFSGAAIAQTGGAGGGSPQVEQKTPDSGAGDAGRATQSPQHGETTQPKGGSGEMKQPGSAQRSEERVTPRKQAAG